MGELLKLGKPRCFSMKTGKEVIANETTYQQQENETDKQFADRVFSEENVKKIVNTPSSKEVKKQ